LEFNVLKSKAVTIAEPVVCGSRALVSVIRKKDTAV